MKKYLKTPEEVIDTLVAGKVLCDEDSQWKLYKGFIMRKDNGFDNWVVNDYILSDYAGLYVDEPKPIEIEVGKFYKTRNGEKIIILADNCDKKNYPYLVAEIGKETHPYRLNKNGRVYEKDKANAYDIVAPWKD